MNVFFLERAFKLAGSPHTLILRLQPHFAAEESAGGRAERMVNQGLIVPENIRVTADARPGAGRVGTRFQGIETLSALVPRTLRAHGEEGNHFVGATARDR